MTEKKKEFPKRKDDKCTSFRFVLCGEALKIVKAYQEKMYEVSGNRPGYEAAIKLILTGK